MRNKMIAILILVLAVMVPVMAQDGPPPMPELDGEIVAGGLNAPQGLYIDSEGTLWVVDSGSGGEEEIELFDATTYEVIPAALGETSRLIRLVDGEQEVVATFPSVAHGEDFTGASSVVELDGALYLTTGAWHINLGEQVTIPNYSAVVRVADGEVETLADLFAYELANNPDETDNIEAHPYAITAGADGMLYVADAASNAIYSIEPESGEVATVAAIDGLPGVFPSPTRGGETITDPVPTGLIANEDGSLYVSLLSGAPFVPGSAKVIQISSEGEVSDFAPGLTMLTDVKMGPDGNLYAVQFGMFTQEGPVPNSGAVVRILEDGSSETIIAGLPFATAIAVDAEGNGYVTINGIAIPEAGMVVYYEGMTEMEAIPMEESDS